MVSPHVEKTCRHCGAIMGERQKHIEWHLATAGEGEFEFLKDFFQAELEEFAGVR